MANGVIDEPVLIDTGPFLAALNDRDQDYLRCKEVFRALPLGKSFTCWPVLTEAAYLVRARLRMPDPNVLLDLVLNDELDLLGISRRDIEPIQRMFRKYHDQEVDLADAAILQLAEREDIGTIFTTDRRHFRLYTRASGVPFRLLPDDFDS